MTRYELDDHTLSPIDSVALITMRRPKDPQKGRVLECAGINRREVANARVVQVRRSEPTWPRVMRGQSQGCTRSVEGGHAGRVLSRESGRKSERRRCSNVRKAKPINAKSRALIGLCAVEDPRHAWKLHAREPGGPVNARHAVVRGPVAEGRDPEVQHAR